MAGKGVRRTRDKTEGEAVAPVVQAPARGEVTTATDAVVRPAAVSHETVAQASGRWTLDSLVEDVLMERCGGLGGMSLHDFLMKHFGKTFGTPDAPMSVFMDDPSLYVADESVLAKITNSSACSEFSRKHELYGPMDEGVDKLHSMRIFSLRQWACALSVDEVGIVNMHVKMR
ncbi:unnamed protein product [Trypanosoma congolense IL3000]|uniref:WGS project CAEQ00000000 data, annotated contig 1904 n=1 Tax=Trypanosoma congolense (strain IL3000) TaxID=1068625 RepID=F9W9W0_TRYCI|nr:unnamed protein product [Trypanosoma congolense IL3000]